MTVQIISCYLCHLYILYCFCRGLSLAYGIDTRVSVQTNRHGHSAAAYGRSRVIDVVCGTPFGSDGSFKKSMG